MRHAAEAHLNTAAERAGVVGICDADTACGHTAGDQRRAERLSSTVSLRVAALSFDDGSVKRAHGGAIDGVTHFTARFCAQAGAIERRRETACVADTVSDA